MRQVITYSEAIEKVILDNGGYASLKYIYENIWKYRPKTGLTPDNSIQERVQRDNRFTRIAKGVYALTEFINKIENNDNQFIELTDDLLDFLRNKIIQVRAQQSLVNFKFKRTSSYVSQQYF